MNIRLFIISFMLLVGTKVSFAQESVRFTVSGGEHEGVTSAVRAEMEKNLNALFTEFENKVSSNAKLRFPSKGITKDAQETILEMWDTCPFTCDLYEVHETLVKNAMGHEIRNIPVTMYPRKDEKSQEEQLGEQYQKLVVSFNRRGEIENISIGMDAMLYKRIMGEGQEVEVQRRHSIINFVENFRTAYNRRDMKFLDMVYSDNALIITGHVVKEKKTSMADQNSLVKEDQRERIEYSRQSKGEYLKKLATVFKTTKYLNVDFSQIDVMQHPKNPSIYGVTLRQAWKTSTYSDDGYLFLVINFENETTPSIQVRTWQPAWLNGKELPKNEVFGLGDFKF